MKLPVQIRAAIALLLTALFCTTTTIFAVYATGGDKPGKPGKPGPPRNCGSSGIYKVIPRNGDTGTLLTIICRNGFAYYP